MHVRMRYHSTGVHRYRLSRPMACGCSWFGCRFQAIIEQLVATALASFVPSSIDDRIQAAGLL